MKLIPRDTMARAFTAGMLDDHLYLVDTRHGAAKAVFDFSQIQAAGWPQLMRVTRDGRRLFVSMNQAGKIAGSATSSEGTRYRPRLRPRLHCAHR